TLLNGELDGSRYGYEAAEVEGISLAWVPRAEATLGQAGTPEERGSAAAWTAVQDVLTVTVTGEDEKTLRLDRNAFGPAARAAHTIIEAKAHSR
ncbi:hypothetical protein NSR32_24235, partial [Salmonella enterica]|nr:hypothetical protein [Salmonella enterica]